jgi:ligand-binding SRPBCC domain-containing protein
MSDHESGVRNDPNGPIAVAVITPSGIFPNDDDYRRAYEREVVDEILKAAAKKLGLTDTTDWVAFVQNRPIEPPKTFADNALRGVVEIEWHKHEGGGGA